jgi:hypothetical protein
MIAVGCKDRKGAMRQRRCGVLGRSARGAIGDRRIVQSVIARFSRRRGSTRRQDLRADAG